MAGRTSQPTTDTPRRRSGTPEGRSALVKILDELEALVPEMSSEMIDAYTARIPSYGAMAEPTLRQVHEVNRTNILRFLDAVRHERGPTADELRLISESAGRRAREGVPLSGVLAAYRSGAELVWVRAVALLGDDVERLNAGLHLATALMRWIDQASAAAAQAYLTEYDRLTADRESTRRNFLDGLLRGDLTPEEVVARGEALGLAPAGPHVVALIAVTAAPTDVALRPIAHRLRALAATLPFADRSLAVAREEEVVVVVPARDGDSAPLASALRSFVETAGEIVGRRLAVGIGRAREGLAEIAASYREASIALAASRSRDGGVAIYGQVLVEELILRERGVARRLSTTLLGPLAPHPELRATLVEYLRHGPSLPAVAARLYLHPNTVAYRLGRIRDLTGRDPRTPAGVAELYLALRAAELIADPPAPAGDARASEN